MPANSITIRNRSISVSEVCAAEMRQRLSVVQVLERADIAFRASTMLRLALVDPQLTPPLRSDEDAVTMLLALGVTTIHG